MNCIQCGAPHGFSARCDYCATPAPEVASDDEWIDITTISDTHPVLLNPRTGEQRVRTNVVQVGPRSPIGRR